MAERLDDNPLTAQIPGFSHRKIRLEPTLHTVSGDYATIQVPTGCQGLGRCETVLYIDSIGSTLPSLEVPLYCDICIYATHR